MLSDRPTWPDLAPDFQDLLRRNGLSAHVADMGGRTVLLVKGHDSPVMTYDIDARQLQALTSWGYNSVNKKAYETLTGIISRDFRVPDSFVAARNANGRVNMGLNGKVVGLDELTGVAMPFSSPGVRVSERRNGERVAGELRTGSYGFSYQGNDNAVNAASVKTREETIIDALDNLSLVTALDAAPAKDVTLKPVPYSDLITSDVYFSNDKWKECLASHGLVVDEDARTLTVIGDESHRYALTDNEVHYLVQSDIETFPIEKRIDMLNGIISENYSGRITMAGLDSAERLQLSSSVSLEASASANREQSMASGYAEGSVSGRQLDGEREDRRWTDRQNNVLEQSASQVRFQQLETGQYRVTAVVGGREVTEDISRNQYNRYWAMDDMHRSNMISRLFSQQQSETRGMGGIKAAAAILAAGAAVRNLVREAPVYSPEFYARHHEPVVPSMPVYFKPGVDSPQDVASRMFDAAMSAHDMDMHRTR